MRTFLAASCVLIATLVASNAKAQEVEQKLAREEAREMTTALKLSGVAKLEKNEGRFDYSIGKAECSYRPAMYSEDSLPVYTCMIGKKKLDGAKSLLLGKNLGAYPAPENEDAAVSIQKVASIHCTIIPENDLGSADCPEVCNTTPPADPLAPNEPKCWKECTLADRFSCTIAK